MTRELIDPGTGSRGRIRTAFRRFTRLLTALAAVFVLIIMVLNSSAAGLRLFSGRNLGGSVEYSEVALVFVVFLALAYGQHTGAHVSTSLVTDRIPEPVARIFRAVGLTVAALFFAWVTWSAAKRGWTSFTGGEIRMGIYAVPVWPARLVIPVGTGALTVELILNAWDQGTGRAPPRDPRGKPSAP